MIDNNGSVQACQWVTHNQLALCMKGCVRVYEVSTEKASLKYTLTSKDWKGREINGVARKEAVGYYQMLVICADKPYVYLHPCYESAQAITKYKLDSSKKNPWCIAANSDTAVIRMAKEHSFLVYRIPSLVQGFIFQCKVHMDFVVDDFAISSKYLVLIGTKAMVVKSLDNITDDVCRIRLPLGASLFNSVSASANAKEIYATCKYQYVPGGCIYKYTWDGDGEPQYVSPVDIIDISESLCYKSLSVSSDGFLAVGLPLPSRIKIYKLQETIEVSNLMNPQD